MAVNFSPDERKALLPVLALCANDCYYFDRKGGIKKYAKELKQYRVEENSSTKNKVQYAVYTVIKPPAYVGKRILALRGTATKRTILQDLNLLDYDQILQHYMPSVFGDLEEEEDGWTMIQEILDIAHEAADRIRPDYITGHSLGGFMAEVVCSYTRIPGMSFNTLGPVALVTDTSFLNPDKYRYEGVKFEIHLRELDPVSLINDEYHINPHPFWYDGFSHLMLCLVDDIMHLYNLKKSKFCGKLTCLKCW